MLGHFLKPHPVPSAIAMSCHSADFSFCFVQTGGSQTTNVVQLNGSLTELIRMSGIGPRLSTEEPMRNSAEAYLKGSLDVSDSVLSQTRSWARAGAKKSTQSNGPDQKNQLSVSKSQRAEFYFLLVCNGCGPMHHLDAG